MAFVFVTVVLPTIWKKAVLQKYDQELEDQEKEVEDVEIAKAAIVDGEEKLAEARKLNHAAAIASAEVRLKELYEALEKERAEAEENVDAGKQGKVFAGANAGMAKTLGGKKLFKNEGLAAASELEIEVELTRVEIVECVLQMIDWFTDIQFAISLIIDEHLDVPWWLIVLAFLAAIAGAAHDVVYTRLMAKRSVCRHMMEEAQWATERDAGQDELNRTESMIQQVHFLGTIAEDGTCLLVVALIHNFYQVETVGSEAVDEESWAQQNLGLSWATFLTFFGAVASITFKLSKALIEWFLVWRANARLLSTPGGLRMAASAGDLGDVTKILAGGTLKPNDLAEQDPEYGRGPLHYAAFMGHVEVVELLIENGAEVNARDNEKGGGSTPLVLACGPWIKTPEASKLETMQLLLSRGADPAAGKADDVMAKHFACMRGLQADGTRHKFAHPESPFRTLLAALGERTDDAHIQQLEDERVELESLYKVAQKDTNTLYNSRVGKPVTVHVDNPIETVPEIGDVVADVDEGLN